MMQTPEEYADALDTMAEIIMDASKCGRLEAKCTMERAAKFIRALTAPQLHQHGGGVEPVAYASSKDYRKNHLMSAAQYNSALPKNRVDFDIPLVPALAQQPLSVQEDDE